MKKIKKLLPVLVVFTVIIFAFQNCDQAELQSFEAQSLSVSDKDKPIMPPLDNEVKSFKVVLDEYPMVPHLSYKKSSTANRMMPPLKDHDTASYTVPTKVFVEVVSDFVQITKLEDVYSPRNVLECTSFITTKRDNARKILEMVRDARIQKSKSVSAQIVDAAVYSISINSGPKVRLGERSLKEGQLYTEDIELKRILALTSSRSKNNIEFRKTCHNKNPKDPDPKAKLKYFSIHRTNGVFGIVGKWYNSSYHVDGTGKSIRVHKKVIGKNKSKGCFIHYRIEDVLAKKLQKIILGLKIKKASGQLSGADMGTFVATKILINGQNLKLPLGEVNLKKGQKYFDAQVLSYIHERLADKSTRVISNRCPVH